MSENPFFWEEFFSFRTMVSTSLIKLTYGIGLVGITLAGGGIIVGSCNGRSGDVSMYAFFAGVGVVVGGNLVWRIACEGMILAFSVHELLRSIEGTLRHGQVTTPTAPVLSEARETEIVRRSFASGDGTASSSSSRKDTTTRTTSPSPPPPRSVVVPPPLPARCPRCDGHLFTDGRCMDPKCRAAT